jgi:cation transport regulator ChaC
MGYERRLDQGSPDHRGTPERLGRVATLVAAAGRHCNGVAYRLADAAAPAILAQLDVREQGGYERLELAPMVGPERVRAITWIAAPGNAYYLGEAPLEEMIAQIRGATGPSGSNVDYVLGLDRALREMGCDDPHVRTLAAAIATAPVRRTDVADGTRSS